MHQARAATHPPTTARSTTSKAGPRPTAPTSTTSPWPAARTTGSPKKLDHPHQRQSRHRMDRAGAGVGGHRGAVLRPTPRRFQALGAQAAAFHAQFVQALNASRRALMPTLEAANSRRLAPRPVRRPSSRTCWVRSMRPSCSTVCPPIGTRAIGNGLAFVPVQESGNTPTSAGHWDSPRRPTRSITDIFGSPPHPPISGNAASDLHRHAVAGNQN